VPAKRVNNMPASDLPRIEEGTLLFKIYDLLRDKNRALFSYEMASKLSIQEPSIHVLLEILRQRRFIVKGDKRIRTSRRGNAYLWAINKRTINKRITELILQRKKNPLDFAGCRAAEQIVEYLQNEEIGRTTGEIARALELGIGVVSNNSRKLMKRGLCVRSTFKIPQKDMPHGNCAGYVYGKNQQIMWTGVWELMPKTVKDAIGLINGTDKVWSSWKITEKTKISAQNRRLWLMNRLARLGIIKYKYVDPFYYFYNPCIPDYVFEQDIVRLQEEQTEWQAKLATIAYHFEKMAIYIFVKYLQSRGEKVVLPDTFPENIPNWFNKRVREEHKVIEKDANGNKITRWKSTIWKFDKKPIDALVWSKDEVMGDTKRYILTFKRETEKKCGVGFLMGFIGSIRSGTTRAGLDIPYYQSSTPVIVCTETVGGDIWKFNGNWKGGGAVILTLSKMQKMVDAAGLKIPEKYRFDEALEREKMYDLYQNHEEVLLGKKTALELMKQKGLGGDEIANRSPR